jgi:MFS family permease
MGTAWRMLARRRDLRLVLSAGMISLSGDWILRIGLIYRVYAVTGSTVVSALTMASSFAPQVLLGALAGVYADRWDRKRTMIAANLLLAAGLMPLLLVHGAGDVWIVVVVMFWEGSVQQFFSPAQQAMVPRLVADDELLPANAVSGQISNASRLAGSAAGGIIAAIGGIAAVTLTDAASFVIAAGLLTQLRTGGRAAARATATVPVRARLAQVGDEMRDGLITLFQRSSEDSHRGRIFGALSTLEGVTILAGTLGAGYLSRSVGIVGVLAIQGGGYVVAGLAMLAWLKDSADPPTATGAQGAQVAELAATGG